MRCPSVISPRNPIVNAPQRDVARALAGRLEPLAVGPRFTPSGAATTIGFGTAVTSQARYVTREWPMSSQSTVDHTVATPAPPVSLTVLVYSDDANVRAAVRAALGTKPAPDLPTARGRGRIDLAILDGEAVPAGGIGIARQLKDEIYQCPPLLVLTGRAQDGWLATWARADAVVPHPIDPVRLADVAAALLRPRVA